MDVQTLRRALYDLFKFSPKDFTVNGSGTGYLVGINRRSSSASVVAIHYGFEWFPAPAQDGVDPDTQSRMIKCYEGNINGTIIPDNMGSVFELPNDATSYLVCTANVNAEGIVTSAELDVKSELVPDPVGSLGVAPATTSRPLWTFVVDDKNKITASAASRIGGLEVTPVVVGMSCEMVELRMFWGAQNVVSPLP